MHRLSRFFWIRYGSRCWRCFNCLSNWNNRYDAGAVIMVPADLVITSEGTYPLPHADQAESGLERDLGQISKPTPSSLITTSSRSPLTSRALTAVGTVYIQPDIPCTGMLDDVAERFLSQSEQGDIVVLGHLVEGTLEVCVQGNTVQVRNGWKRCIPEWRPIRPRSSRG